jgi:hypothetical protein
MRHDTQDRQGILVEKSHELVCFLSSARYYGNIRWFRKERLNDDCYQIGGFPLRLLPTNDLNVERSVT